MQACRILRNSIPTVRTSARRTLANVVAQPHVEPERCVSELLQKTVSLLPRTLSAADGAVGPESALFWNDILERSITELSASSDQAPSKATIAICGFDKWASSHALVTTLLEDPFSSDPTYTDILRNRWKNTPSSVNIEYGKPTAFAGELHSPSDWLQRFPHAIQLTELPDLSSLSTIRDETDSLLLNSDVLLLLADPLVTPLTDLVVRAKHLLDKPNTILILTSGSSSDAHRQSVSRTLSKMGCLPGHILFVDPKQALEAVTALQVQPTSPSAIDKYQRDTLSSGISTVTAAINDILSLESASKTSLTDLRQKTTLTQVHGSLSASFRSIEAAQKGVGVVATKIDDLSSQVHSIRENAKHDILGKPGGDDKVEKALFLGAKEMNALLVSLTFWRMVWRVDEIGSLVSAAVRGQWCKGLENQLILQTGRLESTRRALSVSASNLVSASSSASLRSPVLENQLEQLECLPANVLTPSSLTRPIHHRRSQLIQHTNTKLHREAQSAVVGALGGMLGGLGLGWWLAIGEPILSLGAGTEMGTAIGSGALLAVSSIRWAVGRWERAKGRWTQDSGRVGESLTRDLQSTVQRTVDDNVTIVAWTACEGMQELLHRRRDDIHQLHGELCDLERELDACRQFPAAWTGHPSPVKKVEIE